MNPYIKESGTALFMDLRYLLNPLLSTEIETYTDYATGDPLVNEIMTQSRRRRRTGDEDTFSRQRRRLDTGFTETPSARRIRTEESFYRRRGAGRRGYPIAVHARVLSSGAPQLAHASDLQRRQTLADTLRNEVVRQVLIYRGDYSQSSRNQVIRGVRGFLQGVNLGTIINVVNAASHVSSKSMYITDINPTMFDALMDIIHTSNMNIDLLDIEWTFILEPNTLIFGGASLVKPPFWAPKRYIETWKPHVHDDGTVLNCAAFALTYMKIDRPDKNQKRLYQMTKELMQRMHWEDEISIDDLERYIRIEAPTKRLTVLLPRLNHHAQTTFTGPLFDTTSNDTKHCLYLIYDVTQKHFAACQSPQQLFINNRNNTHMRWCHTCLFTYNSELRTCLCEHEEDIESVDLKKQKRKLNRQCKTCGHFGGMCDDCAYNTCQFCGLHYHRNHFDNDPHRCIVYDPQKDEKVFWQAGDALDQSCKNSPYMLWAYDLESAVHRIPQKFVTEFVSDEDGSFVLEDGVVKVHRIEQAEQVVNLVVFRNVFDPSQEFVYFGADALERFIMFMMNHNHGKNICVAHNGSGYDTRLVFEEATKLNPEFKIVPTARGCKFMQIQVGQTIFRDSMLHLKGSLANLASDFFGGDGGLKKGHFPHLFNSVENYDYEGPLPAREHFDLSFVLRNKDQLNEFNEWYLERMKTPWNFKDELVSYCKNDVLILANLMKAYHDILVDKFQLSPWFHATAPSFVHHLVIQQLSQVIELPPPAERELYQETISRLAWNDHWGVLSPNEYWFARLALRGGRTEVRKVFHEVSDQDWDRGVRIRYQDIVSMYPYVQVACDYPIGLPTIEVYDSEFFPCYEHKNPESGNVVSLQCSCSIDKKRRWSDRLCRIVEMNHAPTPETILADETFFGFVCASLTPPTGLFHPVLVTWDEAAGKCIGSLKPIKAGVFTSVEFIEALKQGYRLDRLHRLDRYRKSPGLWSPLIKDLYIEKMANSQSEPSDAEKTILVNAYEERFGMGVAVRESFSRWGNHPAKKQTFKILLNSGWGKHAQRAVMPQTKVLDTDATDDMLALFKNIEEKVVTLQDFAVLGDKTFIKHAVNGTRSNPNLHHGYLPAAVFVPAYGRLMLLKQLQKLGRRVLMHDTDSIVYIAKPDLYNIPEGDVWGEWSVEKFDAKNGGIKTFIGLGPKSYALEAGNGKTMFKCKGVSIKLAHEALLNYDVMKMLVLDFLKEKKKSSSFIPQVNFVYRVGRRIVTWKSLKEVSFKPEELKGYLHEDGVLYPYNFCVGCINHWPSQRHHTCLELPDYNDLPPSYS